jgi:hypothetical protein
MEAPGMPDDIGAIGHVNFDFLAVELAAAQLFTKRGAR